MARIDFPPAGFGIALHSVPRVVERQAARLNADYDGVRTLDMLDDLARGLFRNRLALVSSFGVQSAVLLHLVSRVDPSLPVIFLDTGKHFGETRRYRDELASRFGLTDLRSVEPDANALKAADPRSDLFLDSTDACCHLRKVEPLARALDGFSAWISGRKRFQGGARGALPLFEAEGARIKLNPLAGWSREDIGRYAEVHDLPEHPLRAQGFLSVGCMPCTERATGDDERDGRWKGTGKTECGIHTSILDLEPARSAR